MSFVLKIDQSLTGQKWLWRANGMNDRDAGFQPDDLVTQLLLSRGVPPEDLERHKKPTIREFMPNPSIFQDMDKAAARLAKAVKAQEKITIYGDYDVDGATSAAVLILLLRDLGLDAGYYIPDRLMEGYGPSAEALVELHEQGNSLIVTVDCGAMAHAALSAAHDAGAEVIVVDHHKCSTQLPITSALVNPNRLDENDEAASFGHLAAVGMAFLLGAAIIRQLRGEGFFTSRKEPNLMALLDIVALGTVADVAKLQGLNRAFVAQGLKIMARRQNIGLNALIEVSGLNRAPICSDLGFALGPRINAGGRVGESDLGVRLLTTTDPDEAREIAIMLDGYNQERRAIEAMVQEEAEAELEKQHNRSVLTLVGRGWHPGVIGIVAGRIKEKSGKPSIVIAVDEDGVGKGSGRSISGVDLGAAIMSARDAGLLVAGGGHAMAAGLTIKADMVDAFAEYLDMQLASKISDARAESGLFIDAVLAPGGLVPPLVDAMEEAGPYGMGWPGPRIVTGPVRIIKADVVGKDHLRMIVAGRDGKSFKAMAFRQAESDMGQILLHGGKDTQYYFAGRLKIDDWGAQLKVEMHVEDAAAIK
ncbi:single-stranded-DNA-specific exonuclease RecJ [Sphingorhabdus lutea]|uniref:Single-stranded-DNA-specific exonuclease RecJ n=1 Tax=Sphingorhabdus lutea TaxID=1913578 RepID=A0A1L3J8Z2_9SPHN|nr:single-stranded-DNA-specific exonuclease RecJ [Sphingorhabdus lutea]APG61580.1 single-stranded-DNA-specific exonuclease RecJ [Sphingorhabdus lutea]